MSDFQSQINKLVGEFVTQVTALARQAAMDTLTTALGAAAAKRKGGAAGPSLAMPALGAGRIAPAGGGKRTKGAKRPQAEIESTQQAVLEFIAKNPGLRIEQINKELGTQTRDLQLPLRKLIAAGSIRTEGEKRATTYYAGEGKPARAASAAPSGPRRRKKK
jgi:hypothetical protein